MIRSTPKGDYWIHFVNANAAKDFHLQRLNVTDTPLSWNQLPHILAVYFREIFLNLNPEMDSNTLPVLEIDEPQKKSYSVAMHRHTGEMDQELNYWFFFVFTDVTNWVSLQEEVMNARRLESIGGLASGVAHDFNNLILAIQGYAEYLLMTRSHEPEIKKSLEQIMKACSNGTSLTRSLLGYSRRQSLSMGTLNLADLVNDVVTLCRHSYGSRYKIMIDDSLSRTNEPTDENPLKPHIYGCYSALSHTFLNLLNNARDSMQQGGEIHINCSSDTDYVYLNIKDEGCGIAPDSANKIFEPFYTTKDKGTGTGLGLSLVQGIMQQHGGVVKLESKIGRGTTVTLGWPHHAEEVSQDSHDHIRQNTSLIPSDRIKQPPPVHSARASETAFLIEDDPIVIGSVNGLLKLQNIHAMEFDNAADAIEQLQMGNIPSLIIVDYTMPDMDGQEFIRAAHQIFRSLPTMHHIRIILMSGYPPEHFDQFIQECQGLSIYLIQKPFSYKTLENIISTRQKRFLRKITTRVHIDPSRFPSKK